MAVIGLKLAMMSAMSLADLFLPTPLAWMSVELIERTKFQSEMFSYNNNKKLLLT